MVTMSLCTCTSAHTDSLNCSSFCNVHDCTLNTYVYVYLYVGMWYMYMLCHLRDPWIYMCMYMYVPLFQATRVHIHALIVRVRTYMYIHNDVCRC